MSLPYPPQLAPYWVKQRLRKARRLVVAIGYPPSQRRQKLHSDEVLMSMEEIEEYIRQTHERLAEDEEDLSKCSHWVRTRILFEEKKREFVEEKGEDEAIKIILEKARR